jgi:hypothetical protein
MVWLVHVSQYKCRLLWTLCAYIMATSERKLLRMTHETAEQRVVESLLRELGISLPELYEAVGLDASLLTASPAERYTALNHSEVWMRFARLARIHAREADRRAAAIRIVVDAFQDAAIQARAQAASIQWVADALRSPDPTLN